MKRILRQLEQPLVRNSVFLILASAISSATGMLFWMVVTRLYVPHDVGLASALLAAIALLAGFSHLGLPIGLIRFLPESETKPGTVNSVFVMVITFAVLLSIVFLLGLPLWSPDLMFVRESPLLLALFVLFTGGTVALLVQRTTFIALRKSRFVLLQQSALGLLKLGLPVALVSLSTFGIVTSYGLATVGTLAVFGFVMGKQLVGYRPGSLVAPSRMKGMLRFSVGQYVAENLGQLPNFLFPLIVLHRLGAEANAFYYVSFLIMLFLYMIPVGVASSLFAESSHSPEKSAPHSRRAMKFAFLMLVPAVALFAFAGDKVLLLFGREYSAGGFQALRLMALSAIPYAFNEMWMTAQRVNKRTSPVFAAYGATAALVIGLGGVLMGPLGLAGVGLAWLIGQTAVALSLAALVVRRGWPSLKASS